MGCYKALQIKLQSQNPGLSLIIVKQFKILYESQEGDTGKVLTAT